MADAKVAPVKVDFGDKTKTLPKGKVSKLDPTQDSFVMSAPAPKGTYDLEIAYSRDGLQACPIDDTQEISNDNLYYKANLECLITNDKEWEGSRVFPVVTTRIGRGKELSTMADLIIRMGGGKGLKPEMSDYDVAFLFDKIVTNNKVIMKGVECDWEGWSKEEKRTVYKTMTDFPPNEKGGYNHQVVFITSKRSKEEITAQLRVKKWPMSHKPVVEGQKAEGKPNKPPKRQLPNLPVIETAVVETQEEEAPFELLNE